MRKPQHQADTLMIGSRYEIKDPPIGRGGMGIVYKAYDSVTRRYVALKTISGTTNSTALNLFEKEWSVLARLSHPNIVDILETGQFEDDGQRKPYFVMPLLPGVTLDHLIKSASPRLTVESTVEIISQTCRGLQAAHDQGLVHRDLKPSNIFVLDDDSVKIIDFGVVHLNDFATMTEMKGTLNYLAPELLERKQPSTLSDIFALGVVCYEALTGRKPFARSTDSETAEAIRNHIPPPISNVNTAANASMDRTVHKSIAKQPFHRFSSAREFSETLRKALRSEPIEYFDQAKIQPRIERVKKAQGEGDYQFAREILSELEAEGHIDVQISMLRIQLDQVIQQKTIKRLMESARTRIEEEEYPLAMQKIQEVLEIDPQHLDALHLRSEIEKQRSERQIDKWYQLVRQHIDNQLFTQARQGLEEILRIKPTEQKAQNLLAKVDREEKEAIRLREEKERLYQMALQCHQGGEISTALERLERLLALSRESPRTEHPEKEAQYQSLYNQIRSEREVLRSGYAEARRHLENKNYPRTLELCAEFLKKNAADPLFLALKLEAEERERHERSAAVIAVGVRLDAEADLERKINILKEAAERYPNEPFFRETLKLTRERRDLVHSILNRANQYEQRSQFNEALGQWDILRNIYPQYPGLDVEAKRLTVKRDELSREEAKARWVLKIDDHLQHAEYDGAQSILREALMEFPGDRELMSLDRQMAQGAEKEAEAKRYFEAGKALCAERAFDEGIPNLRKAVALNGRSRSMRAALLDALIDQGAALVNHDWRAAQPLIQEALQVESNNMVARSLLAQVQDRERQVFVEACVYETRELQAADDIPGALAKVRAGLAKYPNEVRLAQLQTTLLNSSSRSSAPPNAYPLMEGAPQRNQRLSPAADDAQLPPREADPAPAGNPAPPAKIDALPVAPEENRSQQARLPTAAAPVSGRRPNQSSKRPVRTLPPLLWAGIAAVLVLVVAVVVFWKSRPQPVRIEIRANVEGARLTVDGKPIDADYASLLPGKAYQVEASLEGYESVHQEFTPSATSPRSIDLVLKPLAPQLRLSSNLQTGTASLGDQPPVALQSGEFSVQNLTSGMTTVLRVRNGAQEYLDVPLRVESGQPITVAGPITVNESSAILVSMVGARATIFASPDIRGNSGNLPPQAIPAEGMQIDTATAGTEFTLSTGHVLTLQPANRPSIMISLFASGGDHGKPKESAGAKNQPKLKTPEAPTSAASIPTGSIIIEGGTPRAEVLVDNKDLVQLDAAGSAHLDNIPLGDHVLSLQREGYETRQISLTLPSAAAVSLRGSAIALKEFGKVQFRVTPDIAKVTYRADGDSAFRSANVTEMVRLREGHYEVSVEAPGYEKSHSEIVITSGQTTTEAISLQRATTVANIFAAPEQILTENGWFRSKTSGAAIFLRPEFMNVNLELQKPPKALFSHKKVGWMIASSDGKELITYELDGDKFTRKRTEDNKAADHRETRIAASGDGKAYSVHLLIAGSHIVITSDNKTVLDDYTVQGHDFAHGKVGLRTDYPFLIKME
jgi:serine/threonine protein kinase